MDHRDDWPDDLLEGDLDSVEDLEPEARQSAERIARDARNMNAVLSAMAGQVSEGLTGTEFGKAAEVGEAEPSPRRSIWRSQTVVPLAAAAGIAGLILAHDRETTGDGEPFRPPPESRAPSMVSEMDVEADRPFAVFPTSDPDIAVVWLFNPTESDS